MDAIVSQTKRFAHYEIIRKLGRSMTDVYLAFDPRANRRVILKLIEESRDEFTNVVIEAEKRGAQIQSDLHRLDPRILQIYECAVHDGHFFVAMEFFDGKNILEILQTERRLDARRAARYAAEVCSQLHRLHSFVSDVDGKNRAVVHGDIKPSNIQIGHNDELRLLDFGIAKVISSTRSLTQHNLGSPTYCSPERLAKGRVDPQADLWALGVSLYEMVSGAPPYQAQDTRKLENLIQSRRAPRSLPETCPAALAAIIGKALSADIAHRYASAADFENDLRAFLEDKPTVAFAEKRSSWDSNATVQKFEPAIVKMHPRQPRVRAAFQSAAGGLRRARSLDWFRLVSILAAIVVIFLAAYLVGRLRDQLWAVRAPLDFSHSTPAEINAAWEEHLRLVQRDGFLGRFSPARARAPEMKAALVAAATEVIEGYRNGSDPSPETADWAKAQICLLHAEQLDPNDWTIAAKLALCRGYLALIQSPKPPGVARGESLFRRAAALNPKSPDAHLALARVYTYSYTNVGRALAELRQAERLGFRFGPREMEEQGDGYLLRAELELQGARKSGISLPDRNNTLRLTRSDLERARNLYEPISGFSNVGVSLNRLEADQSQVEHLTQPPPAKSRRKPARRSRSSRFRKIASRLKWR